MREVSMSKIQIALAIVLLLAVGLVSAGVWLLSPPVALITAGVLLAVVAVLMASEVSG